MLLLEKCADPILNTVLCSVESWKNLEKRKHSVAVQGERKVNSKVARIPEGANKPERSAKKAEA